MIGGESYHSGSKVIFMSGTVVLVARNAVWRVAFCFSKGNETTGRARHSKLNNLEK
jgi:hypothetical protein